MKYFDYSFFVLVCFKQECKNTVISYVLYNYKTGFVWHYWGQSKTSLLRVTMGIFLNFIIKKEVINIISKYSPCKAALNFCYEFVLPQKCVIDH